MGLRSQGAHALRYTLACRLVENGSSLKEVADLLRHRSSNTTLIYAKLDTPKLAAVALPWPAMQQLADAPHCVVCRVTTFKAMRAAEVRVSTPSFSKTCSRCLLAVRGLMPRISAISRL